MDEQRRDEGFGRRLEREIHERFHRNTYGRVNDPSCPPQRWRSGTSGVVVGGLIVAVGLLLLLDNLGIIRSRDFWLYWPVFLIFLGVARIVEHRRPSSLLWGGLIAVTGVFLLLDNLDILLFNFNLIWPMIIIVFGVSMLWKALDRQGLVPGERPSTPLGSNLVAIFSGYKRRIDTEDFRGLDIVAVFGGVQLDLRRAKIPDGQTAVMDINAVFGGIEIDVPDNWRVNMRGAGIFGGFEDKTIPPRIQEGVTPPLLVVTGAAVFGGVSVRS